MFGIFKSNPQKKLIREYNKRMNEAFKLSRYNRRLSDEKYAEADKILKKIEEITVER